MREDEDFSWFSRLEEQLPSPDELMPISQTLITQDLAIAFNIQTNKHNQQQIKQHSDFESSDINSSGAVDEPARTLKRPRLVWTPQLHKRFVDAVAHLGIKNAVPKTIMQLMSVEGLTRENVASHLQKYRLYLKRMQGLSAGVHDDSLFSPPAVPTHFLGQGHVVPVAAMQQRNFGFSNAPLSRTAGLPGDGNRMVLMQTSHSYIQELESVGGSDGTRKMLTLFPTREE